MDFDLCGCQMMRELRGSLRENSQIMDDLEEFVEDEQPALFSEYAAADPETRQMMDVSLASTCPALSVRNSSS